MNQHKSYLINHYSRYWEDAVLNKYGMGDYEKAVLNLITSKIKEMPIKQKILEIAMGTAFPFALNLAKNGYNVYGMDLSFELLKESQSDSSPMIHSFVGDGEELGTKSEIFDITYCIRSTWFFELIDQLIKEMFRVTKAGGYVIFDIMNRRNWYIWLTCGNSYTSKLMLLIVNLKRMLMKKPLTSLYCPSKPSDPLTFYNLASQYCSEINAVFWDFKSDLSNGFPKIKNVSCNYPRLIFICKKKC